MPRYAAIDIGSNSVRMQAAEFIPGAATRILISAREVTRLGESVFRSGRISPEAMELVSTVLAGMAKQYSGLDVVGIRAVATSAVRDASNSQEFLDRAAKAIGAPVEVISGQEEARLIHLGVQSRWPHPNQEILIVDVGGGSAEIILSEKGEMREAFSKPLGAVRLTEVFLKNDPPTPQEIHHLEEYIHERLAGAVRRNGQRKWSRGVGTSATVAAVVSAINRVPRTKRDQADRLRASTRQVRSLYQQLCQENLKERQNISGIGPRRAQIIIPGAAVLLHVLEGFQLPSLYYSAAGLRDGIIADLAARGVGRELSELTAEQRRVMEQMARRYGVCLKHARKVATMARQLFTSLYPLHGLPPSSGRLLEAAAYLHDIGHFVSDTRHHKHSYYLVANSDMPGFTDRERELIANLCRYHRKAMPVSLHPNLQALNADERRAVAMLAPLLRIADNLDRSREQRIDFLETGIQNGAVVLKFSGSGDMDLEQWGTQRAGEIFREVYQRPLVISKVRQ